MASSKKDFGDFQTPVKLSRQVCDLLLLQGVSPVSIIEPTCGKGSFVLSALEYFPQARKVFGVDINLDHIHFLKGELDHRNWADRVKILHNDFFDLDWPSLSKEFPQPILIIGNPPWVTNSALGASGSRNLPGKRNFQKYAGLDAITGKSNFDISEWMLIHLLQQFSERDSILAMLLKTSVVRKTLKYLWKNEVKIGKSCMYLLDGKQEFGVSVDMCLFVCHTGMESKDKTCKVYDALNLNANSTAFGFSNGRLIANTENYERWKHLIAVSSRGYKWRSGVKHDASKVMELRKRTAIYQNGLNETYVLEDDYIYPLLKSSDIARGLVDKPRRWVLMPQTYIGENTIHIKYKAPKTWDYLNDHQTFFDRRKSSIYKNKPGFSIFGVGDYSFAPWKVAISGFYKKLDFVVVGPHEDKPVILDDTCYFIPCKSKNEADLLADLLNSPVSKEFFGSFIFWDAKRPITANILGNLDIFLLAKELGVEKELQKYRQNGQAKQLSLLLV